MAGTGNRFGRLLTRNLAILTERPGVPGVTITVMAALLLIRAILFPGTGGDDGEQLIFSQFLAWGYQVRNPPLYTWLVMAVSQVTGPNLWAVNVVKFSLLYAMYLFLWRAALHLFASRTLAGLAALSPVLFYFVAWEVVTGFSHTVLTACLYAAVLWILLRLRGEAPGRLADYALLGLAIGLGGLAKYAFWIFLASLLAAAMTDSGLRRRLISPRVIATLAVAAAVAAPHYLWLLERLDVLAGQAGATVSADGGISLAGLGHGARAAAGFLSPFWLIALACFPAAFRPLTVPAPPMTRVLGWYMVLVLAVTAAGTLVQPEFRIRTHYMFVLLFAPFWVLLRAEAAGLSEGRRRAYAALVSLALVSAPVGMAAKYLFEPLVCGRCQHHIPYRVLADEIRALGFKGGTVVAYWHPDPLPGNLRAALPEARVISLKHPDAIPPMRHGGGQCLVVWSADAVRDNRPAAVGGANDLLNAGIGPQVPHRLISSPLAGVPSLVGGKTAVLGVILTPGRGDCR
ncbi:MAG: hypothetical protein COW30_01535 [Rhodospirillales bacterium CG15_BIG_FIL_POST_REV_8_21_14_020_66_15]|nr:MAG: hypothetical protein COW30_01535 [Rhodospirillales bacterium CG15_BIG_FIL_POST_REV_8_21_14_020_66_15]